MIEVQSFLSLAVKFKAVFLDSYGVIKNYKGLIDGAQETIDFLKRKRYSHSNSYKRCITQPGATSRKF